MLFGVHGFSTRINNAAGLAEAENNKIITIPCGMVNCFLITGMEAYALVDTGGAVSRKKIYAAVKDYPIALIILTHGHYDHTQNAAYLAKKLNAKIAMSADDYDLIKNPNSHKTYGRTAVQKISSFFSSTLSSLIKIDSFIPDFYLRDGQTLTDYGIDGTVVELTGHTIGSIGILLNNGRDFIVGDAEMNFSKISEPFLYENYNALKGSMAKIEDSGASNFFFGHGKPIIRSI